MAPSATLWFAELTKRARALSGLVVVGRPGWAHSSTAAAAANGCAAAMSCRRRCRHRRPFQPSYGLARVMPRRAGLLLVLPLSTWLGHGACPPGTKFPSPVDTYMWPGREPDAPEPSSSPLRTCVVTQAGWGHLRGDRSPELRNLVPIPGSACAPEALRLGARRSWNPVPVPNGPMTM